MLIRSIEDGEPVGLRKDVSKDVSKPSCSLIDRIEGEGIKIEDSYEASVAAAHRGLGGRSKEEL